MTIFFISAALLVVLCLLWLLLGLFREKNSHGSDLETVNVTLARERRATLDAAIADGSIDQATFDYESEQLAYDLAADLSLDDKASTTQRRGHIAAAILVTIFVPVAAGALYLQIGNPAAITQDRQLAQTGGQQPAGPASQNGGANPQAPALTQLLPQLEQRLEANPDDLEGWRLLGRSYLSVREFEKARTAFANALALDENNTTTMAQLAESIAMTRNGDLSGEPMTLLERSQAIDPTHEHSLWLISIGRQQAGDHTAALQGFDQLTRISGDDPDALATIEQMRSQSIQALGQSGIRAVPEEASASGDQEQAAPNNTDVTAISVTVSLSENALANADPTQSVFIYATATTGPPMPLAVSRHTVSELPLTVTLDSTMAMIPTMTLDSFDNVTVGARVSKTGNPIAQSGDWFSEVGDINIQNVENVELVIDQQEP